MDRKDRRDECTPPQGGSHPPHYEEQEDDRRAMEQDVSQMVSAGPQQLRSVFADPKYADTVTELKRELTRLRAAYGDTEKLPMSEPRNPGQVEK